MRSIPPRHQEIVRKALIVMRDNHAAQTDVATIARALSYSSSGLRNIFRVVTGRGVLASLNDVRVEHAKRLLLQTSLNVGEVAFAVGCEDHATFTRMFRRSTGTSPTLFRKTADSPNAAPSSNTGGTADRGSRVILHDDLADGPLPEWWLPVAGSWRTADGCLEGVADEDMQLQLTLATPLPENFRLEMQIRGPVKLVLASCADLADPYCSFELRGPRSGPGCFRLGFRVEMVSPRAVLDPARWRAVSLELNDSRLAARVDRESIFLFRDLFPPPRARRRLCSLASIGRSLQIRRVRLLDLGYLPVVPAVRQGDALVNSGLFRQAEEFYREHLRAGPPPEEAMELRFKIGICLLRQGLPGTCRDWVESILPLADTPYWRRECDILLLQADADGNKLEEFARHARRSFRDPSLRDGIRSVIRAYRSAMVDAGFFERALQLTEFFISLDRGDRHGALEQMDRMTHILKNIKRLSEAERLLRRITRRSDRPALSAYAFLSLSDVYLLKRDTAEARRFIAQARARCGNDPACDFQEAISLRSERKLRQAVELCLSFRSRHPSSVRWQRIAETAAAELLACLGDLAEAAKLIERAQVEVAGYPPPHAELFYGYRQVSGLVEARHVTLAESLIREARVQDTRLFLRGQQMVTAGILFELAGRREQATATWGEAGRWFPVEKCSFWGTLATNLAADVPDGLEKALLPYRVRSEMSCLLGLLHEHRGNARLAFCFLRQAVEEDPTLNWPAQLALMKLQGSRMVDDRHQGQGTCGMPR